MKPQNNTSDNQYKLEVTDPETGLTKQLILDEAPVFDEANNQIQFTFKRTAFKSDFITNLRRLEDYKKSGVKVRHGAKMLREALNELIGEIRPDESTPGGYLIEMVNPESIGPLTPMDKSLYEKECQLGEELKKLDQKSPRYEQVNEELGGVKAEMQKHVAFWADKQEEVFSTLIAEYMAADVAQLALWMIGNDCDVATALRRIKKIQPKKVDQKSQLAPSGEEPAGDIKIGLHSVRQALGGQSQLPLFNPQIPSLWQQQYGAEVTNPIDRYGIDLTDLQHKMMEGILKGFTQTRYKGNADPKSKADVVNDFERLPLIPGTTKEEECLPRIYQNIKEIPRLQVQQRELLRLCGVNENDSADYSRAIEALNFLGTTQFCFFYKRLAYDKSGKPEKDQKTREWKKEVVEAIDTLFKVKTVRDLSSGEFKYYEIEPSALFLDQHESYFLLIPFGWREEVKKVVGSSKASSYTMRFLLYLRYQFEERRRNNSRGKSRRTVPYEIRSSWVDIAIALRMPESVYKGKKERAIKIIDEAYQVALRCGYLKDYKREGYEDVLTLDPNKYPIPQESEELKEAVSGATPPTQ